MNTVKETKKESNKTEITLEPQQTSILSKEEIDSNKKSTYSVIDILAQDSNDTSKKLDDKTRANSSLPAENCLKAVEHEKSVTFGTGASRCLREPERRSVGIRSPIIC